MTDRYKPHPSSAHRPRTTPVRATIPNASPQAPVQAANLPKTLPAENGKARNSPPHTPPADLLHVPGSPSPGPPANPPPAASPPATQTPHSQPKDHSPRAPKRHAPPPPHGTPHTQR